MAKLNKNYFDEVDLRVNFSKLEEEVLKNWQKNKIPERYLSKNKNSKRYFSFLDGPITANNPMGVHHAWGRTYKDLWQRYFNLKGFKQRFQNGFDCQGLWVEVEVEKELGIKNKKDIEKFGVSEFVQKCKDRVEKYSGIQTQQSKRLGYFMDWDNSYYTLSDDNNYLIWHFLKIVNENGWLYKGADSVPWCPRCETAISQHEILTEDYKELIHESIILKFPIIGKNREYLLVWTTTPWTIPANIAVAVDKDLDYALVKSSTGDHLWLAKDTIKRVFGKAIKPQKIVKGKDLVDLTYKGPFDDLARVNDVAKKNIGKFHIVIATDDRILPISTDEGTGLVHTAVSAGAEDYKLGMKLGLPMIPVINDEATYLDGLGLLSGKNAKEKPRIILDYLEKMGEKDNENFVFSIFNYKHRYPVCWRCKSELVWLVTDEWYIAMDKPSSKNPSSKTLREKMTDVAKKIKWSPSFGLKREIDWLVNMQDWLISKKNRYWGLALPIWECKKCGKYQVIGSKKELKEKTVSGWGMFDGKSPHKPQIDEVKIKCDSCGDVVSRIEPVGNPWLDAGIVAYSTISENNKACQFYPTSTMPLYLSGKNEWLNWFPADFITESFPGQFKNWFYSLIAMSTVLENKPPAQRILGFATLLDESGKPMHKSTGNMIEFNDGAEKIGVDVMRWMFMRQNPSDNLLFGYRTADEVRRKVHIKLWNIYNFFVVNANIDKWKPGKNGGESENILDKWLISRLARTVRDVDHELQNYKAYKAVLSLELFLDDLSNWYIRRSRDRVGPNFLTNEVDKDGFYATCYYVLVNFVKTASPVIPFISDVIYKNLTKEKSVHLSDWPMLKVSEDVLLEDQMKMLRELVEKIHSERKKLGISLKQPLANVSVYGKYNTFDQQLIALVKDEVNIKKIIFKKGEERIILDTKITPELEEEAKTRELVRNVQEKRKNLGMKLEQKIKLQSTWLPKDKNNIEFLKKKTLSVNLKIGKNLEIQSTR